MHRLMEERNARLAKENTALKASITEGVHRNEDALRRCVKAEYYSNVSYRRAITAIDESIRCLEECLASCRDAKIAVERHHSGRPANSGTAGRAPVHCGPLASGAQGTGVLKEKNVAGPCIKRSVGGEQGASMAESTFSGTDPPGMGHSQAASSLGGGANGVARPGTPCMEAGTAQLVGDLRVESVNDILLQKIKYRSSEGDSSLAPDICKPERPPAVPESGGKSKKSRYRGCEPEKAGRDEEPGKRSMPNKRAARGERLRVLRAFKRPKR